MTLREVAVVIYAGAGVGKRAVLKTLAHMIKLEYRHTLALGSQLYFLQLMIIIRVNYLPDRLVSEQQSPVSLFSPVLATISVGSVTIMFLLL